MTDNPKDAERLAQLRKQRDDAPVRYSDGMALVPMVNFQWIEVDFLLQQIASRDATIADLREERDTATRRAEALEATQDREARALIRRAAELVKTSELPHNRIATLEATIADLERQLAEARADHVRVHKDKCDALDFLIAKGLWHEFKAIASPVAEASGETTDYPAPTPERLALGFCPVCGVYHRNSRCEHGYGVDVSPVAEASGETTRYRYPNAKQAVQMAYFHEHQVPQPTTDHTERAREIFLMWMRTRPADTYQSSIMSTEATRLIEMFGGALTAAERAGAEKTNEIEHWYKRCVELEDIVSKLREGAEKMRALDEAARAVDAAWVEFSEHGNHDARLITALYARLDDLHDALAARDAALTEVEGR